MILNSSPSSCLFRQTYHLSVEVELTSVNERKVSFRVSPPWRAAVARILILVQELLCSSHRGSHRLSQGRFENVFGSLPEAVCSFGECIVGALCPQIALFVHSILFSLVFFSFYEVSSSLWKCLLEILWYYTPQRGKEHSYSVRGWMCWWFLEACTKSPRSYLGNSWKLRYRRSSPCEGGF